MFRKAGVRHLSPFYNDLELPGNEFCFESAICPTRFSDILECGWLRFV